MLQFNGYVAGWLNSTITDFLEAFPRGLETAKYALITCLDSNPAPALLLKNNADLRAAMNGVIKLQKGVLVPAKSLHKANLRAQLFAGFDEIWFFSTDAVEPKPAAASIVGPNRIDRETFEELGKWMVDNDCLLGLGDGGGLNIIVKAQGFAKSIIGHSLMQPEPAFQMSELWAQDEETAIVSTMRGNQLTGKKARRRNAHD